MNKDIEALEHSLKIAALWDRNTTTVYTPLLREILEQRSLLLEALRREHDRERCCCEVIHQLHMVPVDRKCETCLTATVLDRCERESKVMQL